MGGEAYVERLPGGGVVLGELSYLDAEALRLSVVRDENELRLIARLSECKLSWPQTGNWNFWFGRYSLDYLDSASWQLLHATQTYVHTPRGYSRKPAIDGAGVRRYLSNSSLVDAHIFIDSDVGWGMQFLAVKWFSALFVEAGAGRFDQKTHIAAAVDFYPQFIDKISLRWRIEKHEAEDFARNFVSAGVASTILGPRIRLEYLFNGDGAVDRSAYNLPALLEGSHSFLDRHYLALGMETDRNDGPLSVDAAAMLNLRDFSSKINAGVHLALDEKREFGLALETQLASGNTLDDFWYYPDWIGLSLVWDRMNFARF